MLRPQNPINNTKMDFKQIREGVWECRDAKANVPVRVYATEKIFRAMEEGVFKQASNVARLPGIQKASLIMPDGHYGYGFPIGGVAAFDSEEGVVSPGGVGYDINCGVRLLTTNLTEKELRPKLRVLVDKLFRNVPSGVGGKGRLRVSAGELDDVAVSGARWAVENGYGVDEDLKHMEENGCIEGADPGRISARAKKRGRPQLGTLGAGNHFLEIQRVDKIFDKEVADKFGLRAGQTAVMIHCGSRGMGYQIADDYIKIMLSAAKKYGIKPPDTALAYAPLNSREAEDYLSAMGCGVNYAFCNRQVITHWVRKSFTDVYGGDTDLKLIYDVCHNIAKFEEHLVDGIKRRLCVHRKGATRAFPAGRKEIPRVYRDVGQPVLIPGDMGTASYVLVGTEKAMEETFGSTCHGAGRLMSRSKAIKSFNGAEILRQLESRGEVVKVMHPQILAEEASMAYKDVDEVVESVELSGISRAVARVIPLAVVKG